MRASYELFAPLDGDGGVGSGDGPSCTGSACPDARPLACGEVDTVTVRVEPLYPRHGAGWNDYVSRSDPSSGPLAQADAACSAGAGEFYSACVHGGDKRRFVVPNARTCAGLSAEDSAAAFNWLCRVEADAAVFYSAGLAENAALASLVDASGWRPLAVVVRLAGCDTPVAQSEPARWWSNPVFEAPLGSVGSTDPVDLSTAGAVYVVTTSREVAGYRLSADKVSLTTLGGAVLRQRPSAARACVTNNFTDSACLVEANSRRFVWIEGAYAGQGASHAIGIAASDTLLARIRRVRLTRFGGGVVVSLGASGTLVQQVQAFDAPINVGERATHTIVNDVVSSNGPTWDGVGQVERDGVDVNKAEHTIVTRVLSAHHGMCGVCDNQGGSASTFLQLLSVNNDWEGLGAGVKAEDATPAKERTLFVNAVAAFSGRQGVLIQNVVDSRWIDLVSVGAGLPLVDAAGEQVQFGGAMLLGPSPQACAVGSGTVGLNTRCESGATLVADVSLNQAFAGALRGDDRLNESDQSGARRFEEIADFTAFENPWRAWGEDGTALASVGRCRAGVTCRIWDYRLTRASANPLRERNASGDAPGEPFAPGGPCPAAATGDATASDANGNTFLIRAYEPLDDGSGDDDGLCESGEACVYAPNFGVYQGEGSLLESCRFQDGAGPTGVRGVSLRAFATNGV